MAMKVIPVLDLLDGDVVRGVAGRRDEYRPVESSLVPATDPLSIARAFRDKLDLGELYVADLDAILHCRPNYALYRDLADDGFELMIDAGLRDVDVARAVLDAGAAAVIAGLETSPGPQHLLELCERFGWQRVIFSLDMHGGRPLSRPAAWNSTDPLEIATQSVAAGVSRMIVLDLSQVGVAQGVSTAELCRLLLERFADLRIITGGGVRGLDDLLSLRELGVEGVLVASALHNGSIGPDQIASLE